MHGAYREGGRFDSGWAGSLHCRRDGEARVGLRLSRAVSAPGPPSPGRLYAAVRLVGRFWLWFFFRAVDVRHPERVPARGPVLLCINHPNNLIDSLLVGAVVPRPVHYLATATLFRRPPLARFLRRCGVIPVYRRQDDPAQTGRNVEMFDAVLATLRAGGVVAIYPEGTTHAEPRVQRIRTGAARIALAYTAGREAGAAGDPLAVIPVGLSFEARKSFRSRVLVAFGPPLPVAPHLAAYRQAPAEAVEALTTRLQWAIEAQVVHADRIDDAELVRAVEELYAGDLVAGLRRERGLRPREIDPLRLARAIGEAVAHFRVQDPARVERIWRRIQGYRALLAAYDVRDQAVRARLECGAGGTHPARPLRTSSLAALGLPVFVYGALVNAVPYLGPRWLSHRLARKETDYATTRLLASVVAFPLCWSAEVWLVARLAGIGWALAFAASLPVSGALAYHYWAGLGRLRARLRLATLALTRRQAAARLLEERRAILGELERAKAEYLAATARTIA